MDQLIHEIRGNAQWITLNRPEVRNALTFEMYDALTDLCRNAPTDGSFRSIIITGAGGKAFAAGTDMTQFRAFETTKDALDYRERVDSVLDAIENCPIPTIAAINGACTGGGAGIASACDIRIASSSLKFGFPIARTLGNCLSASNLARLSNLLGAGRVKELIFTARLIDAKEAKECGLVSQVFESETELLAEAEKLANKISEMAPLTLRATKVAMNRIRETSLVEDSDLIELCYMSNDFKHGIEAFLTKSKPEWSGS